MTFLFQAVSSFAPVMLIICFGLLIAVLYKVTKTSTHVLSSDPSAKIASIDENVRLANEKTSNLAQLIQSIDRKLSEQDEGLKRNLEESKTERKEVLAAVRLVAGNADTLSATTKQLEGILQSIQGTISNLQSASIALRDTIPEKISKVDSSVSNLGVLVDEGFTKQISRNRSWLASPYPKLLSVTQPDSTWERLRRGMKILGLRLTGPLSVKLVCEECRNESNDSPYTLDGVKLQFEDEAIRFYLHAGIAVGMLVSAENLPTLTFVISDPHLLSKLQGVLGTVKMVSEVGRELTPELLANIAFQRFRTSDKGKLSEIEIERTEAGLMQKLRGNTLAVINLGGNAHLHLGKLIESQDVRELAERRPYGGMVRVLSKDDVSYTWVCDVCWSKDYKPAEAPTA
jgi:hypothetical protein